MAELNPDFFKIADNIIKRIIYRKADKYPQKALGYDDKLSPKEYREELFQDFWAYNFLNQEEKYHNKWKELENKKFVNYIANSIDNHLKKRRNKRNPRSNNLRRNMKAYLKELSLEGVIELFYKGKGKWKTISRARTLFKDKDSKSSSVDLPAILSVLKEIDFNSIANVAKEVEDGINIKGKELKALLEQIFSKIDGWIFLEDLQVALQSNNPLLRDAKDDDKGNDDSKSLRGEPAPTIDEQVIHSSSEGILNPFLGEPVPNIDEQIILQIKLNECLEALTERQMRILELKTDKGLNREGELTDEKIAKILKKENIGCHGSIVNRDWTKIRKIFEEIMQKKEDD